MSLINPLTGYPCTNLDHGFDGSVRDENGKCVKCERNMFAGLANSIAGELYETFSVQKQYPQFDVRLPVVVFDFDGVLASAKWPKPEIGEPDPAAKEAVEHYASKGCEVIVCSARPVSHHPRIWKWLEEQGIAWAIYDVTNIKVVACLYFDDRAVRWPL